ncbi:hypothetical protein N0V85_009482 [Neurospora sp. IMI 360204]|nr:hypothetical protein N0V85_009482 [Neurospora sp. IMI 360204]
MAKYQEFVVETMNGHDKDIATYVHDNLTKSNRDIEKEVLDKASGIFMWVVLVVTMMNKAYDEGKVEAMQQKLREVPKDLDELFATILGKDNPDKKETILMLQWVLFAERPLRPEELYYATLAGTSVTNLGPWDQSQLTADDIQRRITYSSKGLIEVPNNYTVQFIHESVKDFLLRNQRLQSLDPALESNPIGQSHDRLKICCVSYIGITVTLVDDDNSEGDIFSMKMAAPLLARILLEHGPDISPQGWNYSLALYAAASNGSKEMVRLLIRYGADPNQCHETDTPLHGAARYGYEETVRVLLEHGADVNAQNSDSETPLSLALTSVLVETVSDTKDLIKPLLEHGVDVNASYGEYASNALHDATLLGYEEIVRLLLDHGANVNARGGIYGTALRAASSIGDKDMAMLLLEHGADVNVRGGKYGTVLQAAILTGRKDMEMLLREYGATL